MAKVGTSFIDITDLTETLPLTLMLETNRNQNVQIKNGDLYTPNFKEGEGLIITPSLFIGQTEIIPFPYENIRYQVGEKDSENNTELDFSYANKHGYSDISVDKKGRLIYKKNLEKDLTIEARIDGYKHKDKDDIVASSVNASNPKTILFLEQGSNLYNLIITSENGREHFEESNPEPIPLKAILYKGAQEVTNVTYEWDIVTDTDTDSDEDNNYPSGPDFRVVGQNLEVQRSWVSTLEVFQCTATLNDGSNLKFEAQKIIRDFVDNFSATIISDKARILNPENPEITLTNNIYHLGNLVTDTSRITSYSWFLFYKNQEEKLIQEGTSNALVINLNAEENIFPKEDFSILCVALIDGKERVVAYTDIIYRETFYRPVVSPKTIFVPVNKDGIPTLETFSHEIKFQLVDDGNNILDYIGQTSFAPSLDSKDNSSFGIISQTEGKWEFKIPFSLDLSNNNDFWISNSNSKIYEFTYTYLNTEFTEEFEVVKNYAGADGNPGFSGYTIDLSNEFHAFSGGEMRADSNQSTSCLVSAYFGDTRKTIKKIEIGNIDKKEIYPTSNEIEYIVPNNKGYLYFSSQKKQDNEININIKTATSGDKFLTGIEPIPIYITIEGQDGKDLTFFKTFTYTINYNGKSYFLNLSENNIKYSEPTNTYSPNQITISALCRETSGSAQPYNEGKIIYSVDEGKSWKYYENSPIITNSGIKLESIMVRLYSTLAKGITSSTTLNDSLLNENSKYLLDTETISVLTSMEGYQFGGENLLKWSKTFSLDQNKWKTNDFNQISIIEEGDFSVAAFDSNSTTSDKDYCSLNSPRITITEDLRDKEFCLSCYFFCEDYSELLQNQNHSLFVVAAGENLTEGRARFGTIGIIANSEVNSSMIFIDSPQNNKWCRVYKTFKLNEETLNGASSGHYTDKNNNGKFDKGEPITTPLTDCNFFWIQFYSVEKCKFKIKQPMLTLGNVPMAWNASPYDINYSDIISSNIGLDSGLKIEIKRSDPYFLFGDYLLPSTAYTFSLSRASWSGDEDKTTFSCYLFRRKGEEDDASLESSASSINDNFTFQFQNNFEELQSKTFITPSDDYIYSFRIYTIDNKDVSTSDTEILTLQKVKLERGTQATSYFLTDEDLEKIIQNSYSKSITYIDDEGKKVTGQLSDLLKDVGALQTSSVNISQVQAEIELQTEKFYIDDDGYLAKIKGSIDLNAVDAADPYIEIATRTKGSSIKMRLRKDELGFYQGEGEGNKIAYMSSNTLKINSAKFEKDFSIGDLLVSVRTGGVGFSW